MPGGRSPGVKTAKNTLVEEKNSFHTGSVVARLNKDRVVALGTRGYLEKCVTKSERSRLRMTGRRKKETEFTIGEWNVRTLYQVGKYQLLKNEMERFRYDVVGLCEVRWTGSGEMDGGRMIWSGGQTHQYGVGLLLSKRAVGALMGYNPINDRLLQARFDGYPRKITIIVAYAPTSDCDTEVIEKFYGQLQEAIRSIDKEDMKFIIGDWNAKIGKENSGYEDVMGTNGIGERNDRGERLLDFLKQNELYVTNTKFQGVEKRKWTWKSPEGSTRNMIDLILVEKKYKHMITQCRSFPSADIESDHQLVLCNIRMKMTLKRRKTTTGLTKHYDRSKLVGESDVIRKRVEESTPIDSNVDIDERTNKITMILREAAAGMEMEKRPRKPWISCETLMLIEERRETKKTAGIDPEKRKQYKDLCKAIKKSARSDKRNWIEQQCQAVEKSIGMGRTREAFRIIRDLKGEYRQVARAIKDKTGKVLNDEKQISQRWAEYIKELYTDVNIYGKDVLNGLKKRDGRPREDDVDDGITKSEVEAAIKKLKNNKSCGTDDIPAELIKAGGPRVIEEVWIICKEIWETGKWPKEWCKSVLIALPKKGDPLDCRNYRTIALISHLCKIMLNILQERLRGAMDENLSEEQGGFRKNRSTIQQILTLRLIAEEMQSKSKNLYHCFIDFKKAFDSVWHEGLWWSLASMGVSEKIIRAARSLYEMSEMTVKTGKGFSEWVKATIGSRQGDQMSPLLFLAILEKIMEKMEIQEEGGVKIQGIIIKDLRFADDVDLLSEREDHLQNQLTEVYRTGEAFGMHINKEKTKVMVMGKTDRACIHIEGENLECVDQFVYLGSLISRDNDCSKEIRRRIGIAGSALASLRKTWKSKNIDIKTKMRILDACVMSTLTYACESWTLKAEDRRKLNAFEMNCYRRLMGISWREKVTNEDIRTALKRKKTIVERVQERKLQLFGHICRMKDDRLIKTVMFGRAEGKRKRGRQRRRWLDDIKDWTGMDIQQAAHMAQDRRGIWARNKNDTSGFNGP